MLRITFSWINVYKGSEAIANELCIFRWSGVSPDHLFLYITRYFYLNLPSFK